MKTLTLSLTAVALLSACAADIPTISGVPASAQRLIAPFQDAPFDTGTITVLAEVHGDLRSYSLRPCGSDHICGARRGYVTKTEDHWVVTGAYAGRTFYISAGGDGWVERHGRRDPIAWN